MKSKAPLALMEQLVMLLVFALAAALCVQAFSAADSLSRQGERRDRAALLAQNTAEMLKEYGAQIDAAELADELGGAAEDGARVRVYLDGTLTQTQPTPTEDTEYLLQVELMEPSCGGRLGRAEIAVYPADGEEPLFSIPAAWQEDENADA